MRLKVFLLCDNEATVALWSADLAAPPAQALYEIVTDVAQADAVVADSEAANVANRVAAACARTLLDVLGVVGSSGWAVFQHVDQCAAAPLRPGELVARLDRLRLRRATPVSSREALLSVALEAAGDVVEICDANEGVAYVTAAHERVLGYGASEVIGERAGHLTRSQLQDEDYFRKIQARVADGDAWRGLILAKTKSGALVHFDSTVAPVMGADGKLSHCVSVKRDVTQKVAADAELRALNEALAQARDVAVEASRAKSSFLANMSHELRTPLNAILGYSELLAEVAQDGGRTEDIADLDRIRTSASHLLTLINDILDLSRVEAGEMKLEMRRTSIRALVADVISTIQPLAYQRGNELVVQYHLDYETFDSDPTRVRQILLNLVGNANKFTERGPILIQVRPDEEQSDWLAVSISDTGIGMTPEQTSRVFLPFVQADASTTRRYGGSGLGLAISQQLCRILGGHLSIQTAPGQGSTFTVHLPRTGPTHRDQ